MMNTQKITQDEFVSLLTKYSGSMLLDTSTELKMNKGGKGGIEPNPFYGRDVRREKVSVYEVGVSYREKISEALLAEGETQEKRDEFGAALPWGEYEVRDKVVAHNGKRYLRCYPVKGAETMEKILVDGSDAAPEELETIMSYAQKKGGSRKQEAAGISEENRVRPLLFAFDNIIYAVFGGKKYEIET